MQRGSVHYRNAVGSPTCMWGCLLCGQLLMEQRVMPPKPAENRDLNSYADAVYTAVYPDIANDPPSVGHSNSKMHRACFEGEGRSGPVPG